MLEELEERRHAHANQCFNRLHALLADVLPGQVRDAGFHPMKLPRCCVRCARQPGPTVYFGESERPFRLKPNTDFG